MWRAFFLASGIILCIAGAECMILEKAVLARSPDPAAANGPSSIIAPPPAPASNEIKPAEWAPWSLLSCGAVIILYSYTLPRRSG
jgi:hypothetical protein